MVWTKEQDWSKLHYSCFLRSYKSAFCPLLYLSFSSFLMFSIVNVHHFICCCVNFPVRKELSFTKIPYFLKPRWSSNVCQLTGRQHPSVTQGRTQGLFTVEWKVSLCRIRHTLCQGSLSWGIELRGWSWEEDWLIALITKRTVTGVFLVNTWLPSHFKSQWCKPQRINQCQSCFVWIQLPNSQHKKKKNL